MQKEEAKTWADSLSADELRVQYHDAFIHLHLDSSQYDSELDHTTTLRKRTRKDKRSTFTDAQDSRLRQKFLENVLLTGSPEISSKVHDNLIEELQFDNIHSQLRRRLGKERQTWMRAAAVLRKKSVDVDYANIPHLAWLEEVGRL